MIIYKLTWFTTNRSQTSVSPNTYELVDDIDDIPKYFKKGILEYGMVDENYQDKDIAYIDITSNIIDPEEDYWDYILSITRDYHRSKTIDNILL